MGGGAMGAWWRSVALLAMLLAFGGPAVGQGAYPSQQVHLLVPFPAGGGSTSSRARWARSFPGRGANRS